jgi:GntR family transcriptional regulator/MocR family aminotransferase
LTSEEAMLPIALDRDAEAPIYTQIKHAIVRQITDGLLAPGDRLPATRDLAAELGVARISVVAAYDELKAEGAIHSHVGRGTFVSERVDTPADSRGVLAGTARLQGGGLRDLLRLAGRPGVIDFSGGAPPDSFLPVELIRAALDEVLARDGAAAIAYEEPAGYAPLREAVAGVVRARGIDAAADEVLITGGCQQALDLAVQALLNPGDVLLTTNPTYAGILDLARARGVTPRLITTRPGRLCPCIAAASFLRSRPATGCPCWRMAFTRIYPTPRPRPRRSRRSTTKGWCSTPAASAR